MNFGATPLQVDQFAQALQAYVISLAAYSFLFVVQRAFYALSDTRTPFLFTSVQMGIVILLSLTLLLAPRALIGMLFALVWSFATVLQALLATWLLRKRLGRIDGRRIAQSLAKFVIAATPALALGLLVTWGARTIRPEFGAGFAIAAACVVGAVVAVVYLVGLRLLKSSELGELTGFISSKLGRNRS
jgi:putative peptidoglycan lipid II flippase